MRHIRGLNRFVHCANTAPREVPDHSMAPLSLDTPKVISVGMVSTPTFSRKRIRFAVLHQLQCLSFTARLPKHTVCCGIVHDEAGVDIYLFLIFLVLYSIGVPPQSLVRLVQMDIVVGIPQGPERSDACASAAYDGHSLTGHSPPRLLMVDGRRGLRYMPIELEAYILASETSLATSNDVGNDAPRERGISRGGLMHACG